MGLDLTPVVTLLQREAPGLVSVYLLGSHASGAARADSDVDLAFYAGCALPRARVFALAGDLAHALRRDVDLVDLAAAPTNLQMQAIGEGTLIAAPDALAAALFEVRVMRDDQDLKQRRAEIEADTAARGRVHA
jgi:predicted nucleotidyltransferase